MCGRYRSQQEDHHDLERSHFRLAMLLLDAVLPNVLISKSLYARDNVMMEVVRAPPWIIAPTDVVVNECDKEELRD